MLPMHDQADCSVKVKSSAVQGANTSQANRHVSWMKLHFLRVMLECCCQWALFVDSDSFLVMKDHKLSVDSWLAGDNDARVTTLLGNMHRVQGTAGRPGMRRGAPPVAVLSDNPYQSSSYFCAGNLLFTRTLMSIDILNYWFNTTVRLDAASRWQHPWEQQTLNTHVMHRYHPAFWVVPSNQLNSFNGDHIRHLWSTYGEQTRTDMSVQYLKKILSFKRE